MPKFSANLTMLFADSPLMERFERARAAGFRYVEFLFPYEHDVLAIRRKLDRLGLQQVLFNLPAGNWAAGDRGIAAHPDRIGEFRSGLRAAVEVAKSLGCGQVNCLVGNREPGVPVEDQYRVMIENLRHAAQTLGENEIGLVMEALNPFDAPAFLITSSRTAFTVIEQVNTPNLKFQYDVYHMQRVEGELTNTIQKNLYRIGHIQIADNPGRHEPGTGEINYPFLLAQLDRMGYDGFVSLEYAPTGPTETTLGWLAEYGYPLA